MLKYKKAKVSKIQGWQIGIQGTDKVLVEPLCLLHLETYPLDRLELFPREVDYKAYA